MTARPIGPQPMTMATCALGDFGPAHGVPADGHGFGEGGVFDRQSVGDGQGEGLLDDEPFGVGAGGFRAEPDGVDVLATAEKRQGDDWGAGFRRLAGFGTVVDDFAAELMAEDDGLGRAHEVGVAGLVQHLGELVAVVAGVQV